MSACRAEVCTHGVCLGVLQEHAERALRAPHLCMSYRLHGALSLPLRPLRRPRSGALKVFSSPDDVSGTSLFMVGLGSSKLCLFSCYKFLEFRPKGPGSLVLLEM